MGNLRACLSVALLALAGCGDDGGNNTDAGIVITDASPDAKVFMDAPPPMFDLSCMGNAAPTTATDPITLSGTVQRVSGSGINLSIGALADADLEACDATAEMCNGMDLYGTATSAGDGSFSIGPIDTGGVPLDAYVVMTGNDARTTYVFPPSPFTASSMVPVLTFQPSVLATLQIFCPQDDDGNGMIGLAVTDCTNSPISDTANLMLSVKQGGNEVAGTTVFNLGDFQAEAAGTFLICNVPESDATEVGATYNGMAFLAHNVRIVEGTTTTTIVRPGY